ncbi:carbohydrate porin [Gluconobacter kanchanaburiensis]|nr:carbohydrate porin [Gluconobacter kanchanaburiensis]MBF0862702.1 carbohydrate porin [Gluconobacter kanchanaburiensis]
MPRIYLAPRYSVARIILFCVVMCSWGVLFPADAATENSTYTPAEPPNSDPGNVFVKPPKAPIELSTNKSPFSNKALGDPFGARTWLHKKGVDLTLTYLTETLANVSGGRRKGIAYDHQITMGIDIDLQKLIGAKGLSFRMLGVQRAGRDVAKNYVGDLTLLEPQQSFGVGGNVLYHLVQLYLQQKLANDRVTITAGFYPPNMSFGSFPLGCYALDNVTCSHPTAVSVSSHWRSWPYAELGTQIEYDPIKSVYTRVGLFQDTKKDGGIAGFTITTASLGIMIPMEIGWNPQWGRDKLPGHYKIGGYIDTSNNKDLYRSVTGEPIVLSHAPARIERQRGAAYIGGDQMLFRFGPGPRDGLIVMGIATDATGSSLPFRHQYTAGLVAQHFIPGRDADYASIFFSNLQVNPNLTRTQELQQDLGIKLQNGVHAVETNIQVLEMDYSFKLYSGISIVPDLQIIFRPDAGSYYNNALVTGFRILADL